MELIANIFAFFFSFFSSSSELDFFWYLVLTMLVFAVGANILNLVRKGSY